MNRDERRELKAIIHRRIELLREGFRQRQAELETELSNQWQAEKTDEIAQVTALCKEHGLGVDRSGHRAFRLPPPNGFKYQIARIRTDRGLADINLSQLELELQEEIALDVIESEDARALLARVPTLDQLMPPVKELTAGA